LDPKRKILGTGHTDRITEASMSLSSSFVFKRISDAENLRDTGDEIFMPLINETTILKHDHIKGHPNIPELKGVC
jgi:hypothetical protein